MPLFRPKAPEKPKPTVVAEPPRTKAQETASATVGAALEPSFLGANVFSDDKLRQAAPGAFSALDQARKTGAPLSKETKDELARALMSWAVSRGAINYAHWFSPMRGTCAQKHDGFIDLDFSSPSVVKPMKKDFDGGQKHDGFIDLDFSSPSAVRPMKKDFDGGKLFMAETDGSSFPNGGMRQTHTAAAFNTWDTKSPPFVRGETCYIPSCFVAWNGMALDEKTPLLRSMRAVDEQGKRLLEHLGRKDVAEVRTYVGWEQEFFVISKEALNRRPDLLHCGRTVLGAPPARGQQTDGNYFGRIPNAVARYLEAVQKEMWLLGIPMVTYHNEVAPGQHELSPIFQVSNVAVDQNQVCMELMYDLAERHDLAVLFHEKPFAGINGNGKHNNWSVQGILASGGGSLNLMKTGANKEDQVRYTVATACLARGMKLYGDVVRCACIGAGNDHRLGAQEAPPAIMSLYPGVGMEAHLKAVAAGGPLEGYAGEDKNLAYGAAACQTVRVNAEDRNRTAPFPHCGNRFEFRAVGGMQNTAHPNTLINTVLADSFSAWSDLVEGGMSIRDATAAMLKDGMPAIFTGNGYGKDWPQVAVQERGLLNLHNTVTALDEFAKEKNKALFSKHGVFLPEEVEARSGVMFENYATLIKIEATTMIEMVNTGLIPACARDLKTYEGSKLGQKREELYLALQTACEDLEATSAGLPHDADEAAEAHYCADKIVPAMTACRKAADAAEGLIERSLYPFPTYADIIYGHH
eukprot:CAMPEP_0185211392 /NCGR_PEP_ID=MMETSP1140-20130426/67003_1 /TAXON_ID=298111 /ORGANISM="Pavlova sp., Strain CCMP459" /LENGTH=749 /DNA_ID=CAMNT_0027779235 /DNA_START=16 /DNA_END=2265 /DNA_ORIENTATION=+